MARFEPRPEKEAVIKAIDKLIAEGKTYSEITQIMTQDPTHGYSVSGMKKVIIARKKIAKGEAPKETKEPDYQVDRVVRVLKQQSADTKTKYNKALEQLDLAEKQLNFFSAIKEPTEILNITPDFSSGNHFTTPIILLSDWHCEENVRPSTINNLNSYNLDIAQKRASNCFQRGLKLIRYKSNETKIEDLVLWLGGDFISGYIHEELEEENDLSPTEATRFVKKLLISGIEFLINHGNFKKITVMCNYGNHGRTYKKPRIASAYKNSYEYMMFQDIADYFKSYDRIRFIVPESYMGYLKIYDKNIRFMHGDSVSFGGGIGGITVPLAKKIFRYNEQIKADYTIMGHFHQYWEATADSLINGSLIGSNAYAIRLGCRPEPAVQGIKYIDSKYGFTTKDKIICE